MAKRVKLTETNIPSFEELQCGAGTAEAPQPTSGELLIAGGMLPVQLNCAPVIETQYCTTHIDVQLNRRQAVALRSVLNGCDKSGVRLENGRRITSAPDALRGILEAVAVQLGLE
jgi:hypothetical protein